MLGARMGCSWPHWQSSLYVDNLTSELGINSLVSRPRTVGLTVAYSFK
jgi:hypothetical protein